MLIPCAYVIHCPDSKMLLVMFYHVPPVVRAQGKKRRFGCVAYDKRHGSSTAKAAFATAMRLRAARLEEGFAATLEAGALIEPQCLRLR
jgi:hypothetical protein